MSASSSGPGSGSGVPRSSNRQQTAISAATAAMFFSGMPAAEDLETCEPKVSAQGWFLLPDAVDVLAADAASNPARIVASESPVGPSALPQLCGLPVVSREAAPRRSVTEQQAKPEQQQPSLSGDCKDGFCGYSAEQQADWVRGLQASFSSDEDAVQALPSIAGLPVSTIDLRSEPAASTAEMPIGKKVTLHPDVKRRLQAKESRRAKRRSASRQIAQAEWWKTVLENVTEVESKDGFEKALNEASSSGRTVVVDYFAPWCQSCRRQFPEILSMAASNPHMTFIKVNAGNLRTMCEGMGIERLPSYSVYFPGSSTPYTTGFMNKLTDRLSSSWREDPADVV